MTFRIELDGKEKKLKLHKSVVDIGKYKEVYVRDCTSDDNNSLLLNLRSRLEAEYSTRPNNSLAQVIDELLLRDRLRILERQLFSKKIGIVYDEDIDGELEVLYSSIEKKMPSILKDFMKVELTEDKKGIEIIVTGDIELIYRL
jgi:hypothetical protein